MPDLRIVEIMENITVMPSLAQSKSKRYKTNELIFYSAYVLYLLVSMLGSSLLGDTLGITADNINTVKHIVAVLIIMSILANMKFSYKLTYVALGVGLISVAVYLNMGAFNPVLAILFIIGCRRCNSRRVCKIHFWCITLSLAIIFSSALLGIVENINISRTYLFDDTTRYGMGFRNATWFGYIFYLFVDYFYIDTQSRNQKIKLGEYLVVLVVAIITYTLSKGRLEFISTFLLILAIKYNDRLKNHNFLKQILVYSFIIMFALSIVTTYLYTTGNPVAIGLNRILNSRLKFNAMGISQYGISLFGNYVEMQGVSQTTADNWWNYFYIDNFYISYLIQYGVVWMTTIIIFLTVLNYKLAKGNNFNLLVFMSFVALHGFIVPTMMDFISSCTILICFMDMGFIRVIASKTKRKKRLVAFNRKLKFSIKT